MSCILNLIVADLYIIMHVELIITLSYIRKLILKETDKLYVVTRQSDLYMRNQRGMGKIIFGMVKNPDFCRKL